MDNASTPSTALATRVPQGIIQSPQALATQLASFAASFNVLSPAISVAEFAPGYGANLAVVKIDPTVDMKKYGRGPECYYSQKIMGADERALSKNGLIKLSQALGVQWDRNHCRRMDDRRQQNYWEWTYFGTLRTHDGQLTTLTGSRTLDLRDGSAEAAAMASKEQVAQARARGNELCETKAMLRAIRSLGIRQSYTLDELSKPFLIVRFSFVPDMSDPEIKKLVTERALFGTGALYPTAPAPALPAATEPAAPATATPATTTPDDPGRLVTKVAADPEAGLFDITLEGGESFSTNLVAVSNAAVAAKKAGQRVRPVMEAELLTQLIVVTDASSPATSSAPAVDELRVASVKRLNGQNKQSGRPWTLFEVTLSNGVVATTFSESLHRVIDEAEKHKLPVTVSTSESERYPDKANLDSIAIVDKRQGNLPMNDGGKY